MKARLFVVLFILYTVRVFPGVFVFLKKYLFVCVCYCTAHNIMELFDCAECVLYSLQPWRFHFTLHIPHSHSYTHIQGEYCIWKQWSLLVARGLVLAYSVLFFVHIGNFTHSQTMCPKWKEEWGSSHCHFLFVFLLLLFFSFLEVLKGQRLVIINIR